MSNVTGGELIFYLSGPISPNSTMAISVLRHEYPFHLPFHVHPGIYLPISLLEKAVYGYPKNLPSVSWINKFLKFVQSITSHPPNQPLQLGLGLSKLKYASESQFVQLVLTKWCPAVLSLALGWLWKPWLFSH